MNLLQDLLPMDSLEGQLLLASEHLVDPNFAKTVVLLIQHSDQGALGVILNRPTSKTVRELWHELGQPPCPCQQPVHLGGPVSGPLMALHDQAALAEVEIVPGVYFAAKKPHLDALVQQADSPLKLFVGHAGWGPGQLEAELAQGAWRPVPAAVALVFDDLPDLWQRLWQSLPNPGLASLLHLKHVPPDPSLN